MKICLCFHNYPRQLDHQNRPEIQVTWKVYLFLTILLFIQCPSGLAGPIRAGYLQIKGTINPAQADLLRNALHKAKTDELTLLIVNLDTPGGLGTSMREMVSLILNAPLPVVTWVGPRGARAASAGVFLVAASWIAAMSPQTTIGAASPVSFTGQDVPRTMARKVKNDFMGLIRTMAKSRGRNFSWYEQAVEQADTLTAQEALLKHVIDLVAVSPMDLLQQIGARGLFWNGKKITFEQQDIKIVYLKPGVRHKLLHWLLDPQVAYFLLLGGLAGLFFELSTPGAIFPGVFGAICLLLSFYALSILPTTPTGILLVALAFVLFILELTVISHGLLSIAGLICLFLGSLLLFDFEYNLTNLPMLTIILTLVFTACLVGLGIFLVAKAQRRPKATGQQALVGCSGKVVSWSKGRGKVKVRGELWLAQTSEETQLSPGQEVKVVEVRGLTLQIVPV